MAATATGASAVAGLAYFGAGHCDRMATAYKAGWEAFAAGKTQKEAEVAAAKASGLEVVTASTAVTLASIDRQKGVALSTAQQHYRAQCDGAK